MTKIDSVSKIEMAKALKAIKSVVDNATYDKISEIALSNYDKQEVINSVEGLSEEDEFALLTKLMGTSLQIVGLEQRPLLSNDCIISDFIVQLKPKLTIRGLSNTHFQPFTCLVDVKSTKNNYFSIGGAFLKKYRNFANAMNLPLVFAVRFLRARQHALWAIIEDKPTKNSLKVTIQDGIDGIKNIFWDEYIITPNLYVICEFSKKAKVGSIRHNEYGSQISATFTNGKNALKQVNPSAFMTCAMLESFDLQEFKTEKINDDITLQYLKPNYGTAFLSDIIYQMNNLITDDDGHIVYDASKLIVRADQETHNTLIDKSIIESLLIPLINENLIFIGGIGDPEKQYLKWKTLGQIP